MYYCHQVAAQWQLTDISYHFKVTVSEICHYICALINSEYHLNITGQDTKSYLSSIFSHLLTEKYVYDPVDCNDILSKYILTVYLSVGNEDTE